jgi:hypothetical protein
MRAPRPPLQKDPYVLQIADRLLALERYLYPVHSRRVPPLEVIREARKSLRERRRSGALEECLVVVGVEISPAVRDDLRKQVRRVESAALCVVRGLEFALDECPPPTPEQEKRFARRAAQMDAGTSWLKDAEDRLRDADIELAGLNGVIVEDLPGLRRSAMRATRNLRYIARKLKGQLGEGPDVEEYEDTTPMPDPATVPPAVLSVDQRGDSRVLTLMPNGEKPSCLQYPNGQHRNDCVRRGTAVGHMLIAAALGRTLLDGTADSWRRARRAVVTATQGRIELAGSPARPRYSCRVVLSDVLKGLEAS